MTEEEKKELTLDWLEAMMKESEAYENALNNGEISPEQAIDDLFEKYPIKIELNILKQIKEHTLKSVRLFFIVGKNTNMAESVATCIFTAYKWVYDPAVIETSLDTKERTCIRIEMTIKKHSYVGWHDTEIREHLFSSEEPLINHFKKNNMLFLRGINDTKILERLVDTVRNETWCGGVLIINVPGMDIVPQGLSGKFGIIELESSQNDIQIAKTTEKKITKAFYDDAIGILFLNNKHCELSKDERSLIELLKKYIHDVAVIIEHFQDTKDSWGRTHFDTLVSRVNRKCRERLGIKKLIMNEGRGSSKYLLSVEVEDRKFKIGVQKT